MVEQLAGYLNLQPDQIRSAQRDMVLDNIISERLQADSQPPVAQERLETQQVASSLDYRGALREAGYDPGKEPVEEAQFALAFKGTQTELTNELLRRRVHSQSPQATAASASQPTATPPPPTTDAGKIEKYKNDMIAARGNSDAVRRVKAEHRALGVPVDDIGFDI
jgi:hypothetical protein